MNTPIAAQVATAPWLSVLIPAYNVAPYLAECIDSVMQQFDDGVEVLALDDCATDDSLAQLEALSARWNGRVRVLRHARNAGLSAARNSLLDAATGRYVWFLDGDDKLLPGALPALRRIVERDAPDLVLCDFRVWRERMRLKHRLRGELHRRTFDGPAARLSQDRCAPLAGMLMTGELHAWSKIARRALWADDLRFPPGRYFEDMATMPQLALRARSFYYQPTPWVAYRQRGSSILATMNLQKCLDQSRALSGLAHALDADGAAPCRDDARVRLAMAQQSARNLIGAMRFLKMQRGVPGAGDLPALAEQLRDDFRTLSPLSPVELERAYLARGWWLRYLRFHRAFQPWQA
ncbi:glycosyltransferase family 2 protein [Variovorax guangxiensis]|uniref:glycosyltransferase family 2 protein n=1 Tax=Variovorax guangxiensis TaxID=1775474 RepID=UPI001F4F228D|nr:glycosyltransferase family 2 protein [Variovorax guangxiensis]